MRTARVSTPAQFCFEGGLRPAIRQTLRLARGFLQDYPTPAAGTVFYCHETCTKPCCILQHGGRSEWRICGGWVAKPEF